MEIMRGGRKLRVRFKIQLAQQRRLMISHAEHNEYIKLELPGAWESPSSYSTLSLGEGKSSQSFFF